MKPYLPFKMPKMPKVEMPKVKMPKVKMPKMPKMI
jgi:hypothetical protein